jgi:peptide/nickel transport system ATP-binding protein
LLFITHDFGVVAKICDRLTVLNAGRVLEHGTVRSTFERPKHAYTIALMKATPRYDRPGDQLAPVPAELTAALEEEATAYDREPGHA